MLFTVFIPTYNRRHTLLRLFESLEAQTFRDFEWLVIDDGSTDGTGELLLELESWASFPLRYHYQSNGGKRVASNRAVDLAVGQLFTTVDSMAINWGTLALFPAGASPWLRDRGKQARAAVSA